MSTMPVVRRSKYTARAFDALLPVGAAAVEDAGIIFLVFGLLVTLRFISLNHTKGYDLKGGVKTGEKEDLHRGNSTRA